MLSKLRRTYTNLRGKSLRKRLLVIESDDWGAVRMQSERAYRNLLDNGIPVDKNYFTRYDALETNEDISNLIDVLADIKDVRGNSPVITANFVMNNPDFGRIEASNYTTYFSRTVLESYSSYENSDRVLNMVRQCVREGNYIMPQFHGSEHVNRRGYLSILKDSQGFERSGCAHESFLGLDAKLSNNYVAAFDYFNQDHSNEIERLTKSGLTQFEEIFGMRSKSFIASCGVQGEHLDVVLADAGVLYHQNGRFFRPNVGKEYITDHKWFGSKNKFGQIHWRRNVTFEPSRDTIFGAVEKALSEIHNAFMFNKPAVINSHRVNFVGRISEQNRDSNLFALKDLLLRVVKIWPDVEFVNSVDLGKYFSEL